MPQTTFHFFQPIDNRCIRNTYTCRKQLYAKLFLDKAGCIRTHNMSQTTAARMLAEAGALYTAYTYMSQTAMSFFS